MCVTWSAHLYIPKKLGVLHLTRTPRLSEVFIGQLLSVFHLKGVDVYLNLLCHGEGRGRIPGTALPCCPMCPMCLVRQRFAFDLVVDRYTPCPFGRLGGRVAKPHIL